jgi:SAM-dependent methyltransferase
VIDAAVAALIEVADEAGIEWLWIFPRRTLMRLLLAHIPDVLPAYSFALCRDVDGWNEGSPRLQEVRNLRVKALRALPDDFPIVYECPTATLADDLARRKALPGTRRPLPGLRRMLWGAMRDAQRAVDHEVATANQEMQTRRGRVANADADWVIDRAEEVSAVSAEEGTTPGIGETAGQQSAREGDGHRGTEDATSHPSGRDFPPFAADATDRVAYLQAMGERDVVRGYKAQSYRLLAVEPGMQVLDVGCGDGADLLDLAELVGPRGFAFGLDHDPVVLEMARRRKEEAGVPNVLVWTGDAEATTFPTASFDRVRADRVLQHVERPERVVAEMLRVLRPGGIVALVEPDWRSMVVYPASAAGGDDDATFSAVPAFYQRHLPHALIGRQLRALLQRQGPQAWIDVRAQALAFTLSSWAEVSGVLQLERSAQALALEMPELATPVQGWLAAVAEADRRGTFFAMAPLFFAVARKRAG